MNNVNDLNLLILLSNPIWGMILLNILAQKRNLSKYHFHIT